jgi:hypothetical protein
MNLLPSDALQVTTADTATVDAVAFWHDDGNRAISNRTRNAFTVAATKTLVAAPGNSRTVTSVAIRNTGATSVTVTVKLLYDGTNAVTIFAAALAAGGQIHYTEGAGWSTTTPTTVGVTFTLIAPADVANIADNTLANVTGLTFAVLTARVYRFRAVVPYTAAATTTGSRWTVNGPAMTHISYTSRYPITATTETFGYYTALQQPAAANATSLTTGNVAVIEGTFKPSADGTFAIQFASEITSSAITALAGATCDYAWVLGD